MIRRAASAPERTWGATAQRARTPTPEPGARHLDEGLRQLDRRPAAGLYAGRPQHVAIDVELLARNGEGEERLAREVGGLDVGPLRQGMARAHHGHELVVEERVDVDPAAPDGIADDRDVEVAGEKRGDRAARGFEHDAHVDAGVGRLE